MKVQYFSLGFSAYTYASVYNEQVHHNDYSGPSGNLYQAKNLDQHGIDAILNAHNEVRDEAAGGLLNGNKKAKSMVRLTWDEDLAASAQAYANQCNWAHSYPSGFHALPYSYSENMWTTSAFNVGDSTLAVDSWAAENVHYDHDNMSCADGQQCAHYTQIVSSATRRVGCAVSECSDVNNIGWGGGTLVVCQYYPPGNTGLNTPYEYSSDNSVGADCPNGMDGNYGNLCKTTGLKEKICTEDNRCVDSNATCNPVSKLAYTCDCSDDYSGKWCQTHSCGTVTIDEKSIGQASWVWENGQPVYFKEDEKSQALAYCDNMNENNPGSCFGITRRHYISWFFYYPLSARDPSNYVDHPGGQIIFRDCSGDYEMVEDDGSNDDSNSNDNSGDDNSNEVTDPPLNYDDLSLEMKMVGKDGKIRVGSSYGDNKSSKCLGLDPYVKNGTPKPWHYNSKIEIQDCIDNPDDLPYEADHQSWEYDEVEGTICTGYQTQNMVQKNFRYCILSNYKQGGNRPLKLYELAGGDAIRYGFTWDYVAGQIRGRESNPTEVIVWKESAGKSLWVKKMLTNSHFGAVDAEFASL